MNRMVSMGMTWRGWVLLLALLGLARVAAADEFLEPEKAFQIAVRAADERSVEVSFRIAPGYYMYREQFKFSAQGATLGAPELPPGKVKFDENFQKNVETYREEVRIHLPVQQASASFRLTAVGQGCADAGLCYPPMPSVAEVKLTGFGGDGSARVLATGDAAQRFAAVPPAAATPAATPTAATAAPMPPPAPAPVTSAERPVRSK